MAVTAEVRHATMDLICNQLIYVNRLKSYSNGSLVEDLKNTRGAF